MLRAGHCAPRNDSGYDILIKNIIMNKKTVIEEIKEKARPILREAGVKHASVFGSVARGDQTTNSDLDILIDVPDDMTLFGFIDLEHKLEDVLEKKVDLVDATGLKPQLKQYILRDQIAIL